MASTEIDRSRPNIWTSLGGGIGVAVLVEILRWLFNRYVVDRYSSSTVVRWEWLNTLNLMLWVISIVAFSIITYVVILFIHSGSWQWFYVKPVASVAMIVVLVFFSLWYVYPKFERALEIQDWLNRVGHQQALAQDLMASADDLPPRGFSNLVPVDTKLNLATFDEEGNASGNWFYRFEGYYYYPLFCATFYNPVDIADQTALAYGIEIVPRGQPPYSYSYAFLFREGGSLELIEWHLGEKSTPTAIEHPHNGKVIKTDKDDANRMCILQDDAYINVFVNNTLMYSIPHRLGDISVTVFVTYREFEKYDDPRPSLHVEDIIVKATSISRMWLTEEPQEPQATPAN